MCRGPAVVAVTVFLIAPACRSSHESTADRTEAPPGFDGAGVGGPSDRATLGAASPGTDRVAYAKLFDQWRRSAEEDAEIGFSSAWGNQRLAEALLSDIRRHLPFVLQKLDEDEDLVVVFLLERSSDLWLETDEPSPDLRGRAEQWSKRLRQLIAESPESTGGGDE